MEPIPLRPLYLFSDDVSEDDESSIISESVIEEMPKNDWSPANSQKENMSEVQTADDEPDMYSWPGLKLKPR